MKVIFVSTYPPTKCGIADYTKNLHENLKRIQTETEIVKINNPLSKSLSYFEKLAEKAAEHTSEKDIIHIQFQILRFGKFLGIFPGFYIMSFLKKLKSLTKANVIITLHDIPSKRDVKTSDFKLKLLLWYYRFIYYHLKKNCDKIIVHSENARQIAINEWGFAKHKIEVIHLGLPDKVNFLDKEKCKRELGVQNKKVLLIFGYARRYKNYDMVLETLKDLDKNIILIITGGVQMEKHKKIYSNFLKKIKELGVEDRVKILGFVEEKRLPVLLNATDIGILPYTKTFGDFNSAAMSEQIAYKIPLLCADIHPFETFKKEHQCIETFNRSSKNDLVKKMSSMLKKKDKHLEKKIRKYLKKAGWSPVAQRHKKIYLDLIRK